MQGKLKCGIQSEGVKDRMEEQRDEIRVIEKTARENDGSIIYLGYRRRREAGEDINCGRETRQSCVTRTANERSDGWMRKR